MPRSTYIVWNKTTRETLSRQVKRFNAKLRRELKKDPSKAGFLPALKSVRQLRQSIKTKSDLRQVIRDINLLFQPDALSLVSLDKNIVTTRYQLMVTKNAQRRIAYAQQKELERISKLPGFYGLTKEQERYYSPPKYTGDSQSGWKAFTESVSRLATPSYEDTRHHLYHDNFKKALYAAFDPETAGKISNIADKLSETDLYDAYYDNPNLTIEFIYGLDDTKIKAQTITRDLVSKIAENSDIEGNEIRSLLDEMGG